MKAVHEVKLCGVKTGSRAKCNAQQPLSAGVIPEDVCVDPDECPDQVRAIITIETMEEE